MILTNGRDEGLGFNSQLGFFHDKALIRRCPGLGVEGVEGEDGLIKEQQLHLIKLGESDKLVHLIEHLPNVHLTVIKLLLAFLNVFIPDAMLLIEPPESRGTESDLWESSMDQYAALFEREMSLGFQGIVV